MTTQLNFADRRKDVVILREGQVQHMPYRYPQKAYGKCPSPGPVPVKARKDMAELPDDLARFMAYAG